MTELSLRDKPPSPPASVDEDKMSSMPMVNSVPRDMHTPRTPPRSIPALSADTTLVSSPLPSTTFLEGKFDLPDDDQYGDPTFYQTGPIHTYHPIHPVSTPSSGDELIMLTTTQVVMSSIPYHSPPLPVSESGIKTRSGRTTLSPQSPSYSERRFNSPKAKKTKTGRIAKGGRPLIHEPLSILTKDYDVPVRDMHAWVNRSVAQRLKEVEDKKGYISRPMNSFMLYRSAYADRVKRFCKENNHQVVSQVTGASWPLEPKHVRNMYEGLAIAERDNHQHAHPNYKFAPNKAGKKRQQVQADDSDSDPDWEGSSRRTKRSRSGRREETRSQSSTPFEQDRNPRTAILPQYVPTTYYHPSSYQSTNPNGPTPVFLGSDGMTNQYYQQRVTPYAPQVDDIRFDRIEHPLQMYDMGNGLVGLPTADNHQQQHHQYLSPQPVMMHASQASQRGGGGMIDPRLASFDPNQYDLQDPMYASSSHPHQHYQYASYAVQQQPDMQTQQAQVGYHPGLATLTDGSGSWGAETGYVGSAFDEEFRKMH